MVFLLLFLPIASRTKQQRNRHKGHCTRLREALSLVQATIAETKLNPSLPGDREREGSDHYTRSCEEVRTRIVYPAGRRTDSSTSPRDTQWTSRRMGFVEHRMETAMNRCRHATESGHPSRSNTRPDIVTVNPYLASCEAAASSEPRSVLLSLSQRCPNCLWPPLAVKRALLGPKAHPSLGLGWKKHKKNNVRASSFFLGRQLVSGGKGLWRSSEQDAAALPSNLYASIHLTIPGGLFCQPFSPCMEADVFKKACQKHSLVGSVYTVSTRCLHGVYTVSTRCLHNVSSHCVFSNWVSNTCTVSPV